MCAGAEGIEPPVVVLETTGLPLTDTPKLTDYLSYIIPFKLTTMQSSLRFLLNEK